MSRPAPHPGMHLTFLDEGPGGRGRWADPDLFQYDDLYSELRAYAMRIKQADTARWDIRSTANRGPLDDLALRNQLGRRWWTNHLGPWKRSWAHLMKVEFDSADEAIVAGVIRVPSPDRGPGWYYLDDRLPMDVTPQQALSPGDPHRLFPAHIGSEQTGNGSTFGTFLYRGETGEVVEVATVWAGTGATGGRVLSPNEGFLRMLRHPGAGSLLEGDIPCILPIDPRAPRYREAPVEDGPVAVAILRKPRRWVVIPLWPLGWDRVRREGPEGSPAHVYLDRYRLRGPQQMAARFARGVASAAGAALDPDGMLRDAETLAGEAEKLNPISSYARAMKADVRMLALHVFRFGRNPATRMEAGLLAAEMSVAIGEPEGTTRLVMQLEQLVGAPTAQLYRLMRVADAITRITAAGSVDGASIV